MTQTPEKHIELSTYFHTHFSKLEDPRRTTKGNFAYPLDEILFLVISAVISGMENWISISNFGKIKIEWLRRFLPYENGTPSHDVLGKLFARIETTSFNECFINWVNSISEITEGEVVAIDGKSIRGPGESGNAKSMLHIVSAFASKNKVCLAQTTVGEKHNEIVAIPKVLDMLAIKGCVVTIDAMGCQKEIATKIIDKDADYILMVKDNQKGLKEQIEKVFKINHLAEINEATDIGHGRIESRICEAIDSLEFLDGKDDWKGLRSVVRVKTSRYIKRSGKESNEIRYYITSLPPNAEKLNRNIRSHWSIENNLNWSLDVQFNEDRALRKKDFSASNFNIINKMAMTLLQNETSYKASKNAKRERAALDDDYREKVLKS